MAFCNSCGATLNPGTKFCNKCGSPIAAGPSAALAAATTPAPPMATAPPPTTGGSSALKIILIVVAVIVVLGILGMASVGFLAYRVAKSAHVTQKGDQVKVESPFGSFSANDPEQTAKDLGIDIYPGAEVQKNGTVSATVMGVHTVTAIFESSDSPDKICSFYKERFPSATVTSSDQNRCNIVSNDQKNMVTINIESSGDNSKLQITSVSRKSSN